MSPLNIRGLPHWLLVTKIPNHRKTNYTQFKYTLTWQGGLVKAQVNF